MNYAIQILNQERKLIQECLNQFTEKQKREYSTSVKIRENRIKEIDKAIEVLKG